MHPGDTLILRSVHESDPIPEGALVLLSVEGGALTIRRYRDNGNGTVSLAFPGGGGKDYQSSDLEIQGILASVYRSLG